MAEESDIIITTIKYSRFIKKGVYIMTGLPLNCRDSSRGSDFDRRDKGKRSGDNYR